MFRLLVISTGLQGSFKDGKREGYWFRYWDNGQLAYKGNFKNGLEEGAWVGYWNNGQLSYKGSYKNGNREEIGWITIKMEL